MPSRNSERKGKQFSLCNDVRWRTKNRRADKQRNGEHLFSFWVEMQKRGGEQKLCGEKRIEFHFITSRRFSFS